MHIVQYIAALIKEPTLRQELLLFRNTQAGNYDAAATRTRIDQLTTENAVRELYSAHTRSLWEVHQYFCIVSFTEC